MIGLFSDSYGDLAAFDAAYRLLKGKGAKRFFFLGGRYADLDAWEVQRRESARGGRPYSDADFLADVGAWVGKQEVAARAPALQEGADEVLRLKDKFVRVPERDCLQYLDSNVPKKVVDMLGDALCCLVHDKNDLTRDDLVNGTFFLHGKGAEPKVVQIGPRYFLTPGQLTGAAEQTCALIHVEDKRLAFSAFTLDGRTLLDAQELALDKRNKLSVK